VGRVQYDPYGEVLTSTLPVTLTDRLFTGARFNGTIGLYQMGARWYDPALGRWLQADTIVPEPGNPQALNRYAYVYNNPLRYTDPSGHWIFEERPGDPYIWYRDKPANTLDTLIRTAEPVYIPPGYRPSVALRQAMGIVRDWFFETDDEVQWFGPDAPLTQDVRYDPALDQFREAWKAEGYRLPFGWKHSIDVREGPLIPRLARGAVAYTVENVELAVCLLGLGSTVAEGPDDPVGGVLGSLDRISVYDMGNGMVMIMAYNETGWASGTRVFGTDIWIIDNRSRSDWGPGGTIWQYFYWQEPYPPTLEEGER